MLPWLLGQGEKMVQTFVSLMNVYPGLTIEDDE
jgi:hypothetical protein